MNPKILISGATGQTGSIATQLLLARGFDVRALVRKEDERSERLKALGAEVLAADILDFRAVQPMPMDRSASSSHNRCECAV
ncbi:NmrA-like family protein [Paraburkholderia sp. BL18I3N2]|uniref:NmrA family NAD(P)-binding protein n=1 Tax=Paraburkholderia sp. BL18I3N2 TaxID=1938799 RepID=UPI000D07C6CE|nr:NmrA family NAD(P)-binding protein [Paraburkholderia sp. BL18I3N2]PRX31295.1 NmrA-like family protein [Paraburkholderia sp. BL18I3N2]